MLPFYFKIEFKIQTSLKKSSNLPKCTKYFSFTLHKIFSRHQEPSYPPKISYSSWKALHTLLRIFAFWSIHFEILNKKNDTFFGKLNLCSAFHQCLWFQLICANTSCKLKLKMCHFSEINVLHKIDFVLLWIKKIYFVSFDKLLLHSKYDATRKRLKFKVVVKATSGY